jgi:septum formation inhibitor-activating ATPase MinD
LVILRGNPHQVEQIVQEIAKKQIDYYIQDTPTGFELSPQ